MGDVKVASSWLSLLGQHNKLITSQERIYFNYTPSELKKKKKNVFDKLRQAYFAC